MNRLVTACLLLPLAAACGREAPVAPAGPVVGHDFVTPAGYEVIDLGTLGGPGTVPAALNDGGQVVGSSNASDGPTRPFLWEGGAMGEGARLRLRLGHPGHRRSP